MDAEGELHEGDVGRSDAETRADGARGEADLGRRAREADAGALLTLLREHFDEIDVPTARQVLRNPFVTTEAIELLLENTTLLSAYELRRDLALHPRTPEIAALGFVPGLFWRDLARLGASLRVRPKVRTTADRYLVTRLPALSLGEKISMARVAGSGLLAHLRQEGNVQVMAAVLQNPKLTEGQLMPVIQNEGTPAEILDLIAKSYRWGNRYTIRMALVRNHHTPASRALSILSTLKKTDLRQLLRERKLAPVLQQRARLLLGERQPGPN